MIRSAIPLFSALLLLGACSSSGQSDASSDDATASTIAADEASADGDSANDAPAVEPAGDDELGVSVNGTELTVAEFDEHLESWARLAEAEAQTVRDTDGELLAEFVGGITQQYLQFESFMDAIKADGVTITEEDRTAAEATALTSLGEPNDESARASAVEWLAGLAAIEPSEAELDAYVAENAADLTTDLICSSHILVETTEEADAAVARLEGGEAFADVATELSIDPGSGVAGGDLGCVGPGAFVPEFEEAALAATFGEATDPVESQFGFHIIVTREPATADLRPAAAAQFEAVARTLLDESVTSATIEIAPQFGSWDDTTSTYSPPT